MANVTTLKLGGATNVGTGFISGFEYFVHEIDIADAVAAGLATTEYVEVVSLPADTVLDVVQVEVVTSLSLGAGARIDLGDSIDDDEFVTNATTLTAGTNLTLAATRFVYSAADSLRLKVTGGTIASGKIRFVFGLLDTSRIEAGTSPVTP